MKTINQLREEYIKEQSDRKLKYRLEIKHRLQDLKLDKLVKRKEDGKIGMLDIDGYFRVEFFPLTKKGTKRIYSEGYIRDVEAEFEPYNEESEA